MGARARFRARATSLLSEYQRLERAALDAARRNNASLWYVGDSLQGVYEGSSGGLLPTLSAPVGMISDHAHCESRLGPELVSNGTFDDGLASFANTSTGSGVAFVENGILNLFRLNQSNIGRVTQVIATTPGKQYKIAVDKPDGQQGFVAVASVGGNFSGTHVEFVFTATSESSAIFLETPIDGAAVQFDNLSVRELVTINYGPETELIQNGNFDSGAFGWSAVGASVAIVNGTLVVTAGGAGSYGVMVSNLNNIPMGMAKYEFTVVAMPTSGGFSGVYVRDSEISRIFSPGKYSGEVMSFNTSSLIGFFANAASAGESFVIDKISVKSTLGIPIRQSTTASKPTLVRVPRKFGPELIANGNFSNGSSAWFVNSGVTISDGSCAFNVGGPTSIAYQDGVSLEGGAAYSVAAKISGPANVQAYLGGIAGGASNGTLATTIQMPATVSGSRVVFNTQTAGTGTIDNISVRKVIEWGYAIEFDGVNDFFTGVIAPAVNEELSWGIVITRKNDRGTFENPYNLGTNDTDPSSFSLKLRSNNTAWSRAAGYVTSGAGTVVGGTPIVYSASIKNGIAGNRFYINGALAAVGGLVGQTSSATSLYVGMAPVATEISSMKFHCAWLCRTVLPDADRIAIEKFAAYLAGAENYVG